MLLSRGEGRPAAQAEDQSTPSGSTRGWCLGEAEEKHPGKGERGAQGQNLKHLGLAAEAPQVAAGTFPCKAYRGYKVYKVKRESMAGKASPAC